MINISQEYMFQYETNENVATLSGELLFDEMNWECLSRSDEVNTIANSDESFSSSSSSSVSVYSHQVPSTNRRPLQSISTNTCHATPAMINELTRIEKRNERERNRVEKVNKEFAKLRELLLHSAGFKSFSMSRKNNPNHHSTRANKENRAKKMTSSNLSKVKTLRAAIDYIQHLKSILDISQTPHYENQFQLQQHTESLECNFLFQQQLDDLNFQIDFFSSF